MPARVRFSRSIARVETLAPTWQSVWPELHPRAWLARLAPTRRSVGIGLAILGFALGGYLLARETSLFAIDTIEVQGGSAPVARQVREALAPFAGKPLVGLDGSAVLARVDALPTVFSASFDRDFPHTLRITVVPERPAAVLRRGPQSWLVSTRGRVMERLASSAVPRLPRIWISTRYAGQHRRPGRRGRRRHGCPRCRICGCVRTAHRLGLVHAWDARVSPSLGPRADPRRRERRQAQARGRPAGTHDAAGRLDVPRRQHSRPTGHGDRIAVRFHTRNL